MFDRMEWKNVALNYLKKKEKKMRTKAFMKTEPTTRKQTVNKIPIFQSRIIFIAAYFLCIFFRCVPYSLVLFCFFFSTSSCVYLIFSWLTISSRIIRWPRHFRLLFLYGFSKIGAFHQFSGDALPFRVVCAHIMPMTINSTRK